MTGNSDLHYPSADETGNQLPVNRLLEACSLAQQQVCLLCGAEWVQNASHTVYPHFGENATVSQYFGRI